MNESTIVNKTPNLGNPPTKLLLSEVFFVVYCRAPDFCQYVCMEEDNPLVNTAELALPFKTAKEAREYISKVGYPFDQCEIHHLYEERNLVVMPAEQGN